MIRLGRSLAYWCFWTDIALYPMLVGTHASFYLHDLQCKVLKGSIPGGIWGGGFLGGAGDEMDEKGSSLNSL